MKTKEMCDRCDLKSAVDIKKCGRCDLIDLRSRQETESTDAEERRIKVRFTRANIKTAYEMAKLIRERIEKRKKFLALKKVI